MTAHILKAEDCLDLGRHWVVKQEYHHRTDNQCKCAIPPVPMSPEICDWCEPIFSPGDRVKVMEFFGPDVLIPSSMYRETLTEHTLTDEDFKTGGQMVSERKKGEFKNGVLAILCLKIGPEEKIIRMPKGKSE